MSVIAPGWAGVLCFGTVWGKHFLQKKSDQNQPDMTVVAALPRMGGSHPVPSLSINPTERRVQQCTVCLCLCLCLIIVSCGVAQYSGLVGGIFGPWHSTTPPTCCNHHHMVMIIMTVAICHHHKVIMITTTTW